MSKVHLQANKGEDKAAFSFCASRVNGRGKVEFNNRRSYAFMASEIVRGPAFLATPADRRCAHCLDVLKQREGMYPKFCAKIFG